MATNLAKRLDGLPLALATAGAYLGRTGIPCEEYLDSYQNAWKDLVGASSEQPLEYNAGTMNSTWKISLDQVQRQHNDAAELLKFLGYLDNKDIWFELIQTGTRDAPLWMKEVTKSRVLFRQTMSHLQDYNLVDVTTDSYQVHRVLHDWLRSPPRTLALCRTAIYCVGDTIDDPTSVTYHSTSRRLLDHAERLELNQLQPVWELAKLSTSILNSIHSIVWLLRNFGKLEHAEKILTFVLAKEKARRRPRKEKFGFYDLLGSVYADQGKDEEAKQMYLTAKKGFEDMLGPDHEDTLAVVHNLAAIYQHMGKLQAAEGELLLVIKKLKSTMQTNYESVPASISIATADQGVPPPRFRSFDQKRAAGALLPQVLVSIGNLGLVYQQLGKYEEAQKMHTWVLLEMNERLGGHHPSAQNTIIYIGNVLQEQGNHEAAERIYMQALRYVPEPRDSKDLITPESLRALAILYYSMNRLDKLLELITEQRNLPPSVFGHLGRLLLRRTDDPNAQMAFCYQIAKDGSFMGNTQLWCNGCRCLLSIVTRRWICRSCRDVDLCRSCFSKEQNGTLGLVNCLDHQFYGVVVDRIALPVTGSVDEDKRLSWLQALRDKYPNSSPISWT